MHLRDCVKRNAFASRRADAFKKGVEKLAPFDVGVPKIFCFHERRMNSLNVRAAVKTIQLRRYYATVIA